MLKYKGHKPEFDDANVKNDKDLTMFDDISFS
jgi:hypothetical protein